MDKKIIIGAAAIALGVTAASSQEIGTWAGFRTAAVSFTFDDGAPSQVSDGAPMFDKYGYKGTFNLVTSWNPNWSGFQGMADTGHEIASHSDTHGQNMSGEEASSKNTISGKIKQKYGVITVAYPNCNVPNASAVSSNYIVGRICNGSWQSVPDVMDKNGPSDWTKVPALMTGSTGINTTDAYKNQMNSAIQKGGWVAFLTHGFEGKNNGSATYSPTSLDAMEGALKWAKENDSKVWVAPMGFVGMYIKERNAAKIAEKSNSGSSITYTLTHSIANSISKFDYPLSIRVKSSWTKVTATQDGKAIDASIKDGYIYFDAVPNGGDIVLSSGDATTPVASSSSVAPPAASSSSVVPPANSSSSSIGNPFFGFSSSSVAPTSSATIPGSSSSAIMAIAETVQLDVFSGELKCSVFDMNGNLVKTMQTTAGSIKDLWNNANAGLNAGMYIMRYGQAGKAMQTVRVRK